MTMEATEQPGPKGTTHAAECPECGRTTLIRFLPTEVHIRESCEHFRAVIRTGECVEVEFAQLSEVAQPVSYLEWTVEQKGVELFPWAPSDIPDVKKTPSSPSSNAPAASTSPVLPRAVIAACIMSG